MTAPTSPAPAPSRAAARRGPRPAAAGRSAPRPPAPRRSPRSDQGPGRVAPPAPGRPPRRAHRTGPLRRSAGRAPRLHHHVLDSSSGGQRTGQLPGNNRRAHHMTCGMTRLLSGPGRTMCRTHTIQAACLRAGVETIIRQDPRAGCCRPGRQAGKDRLAARWPPQLPMNVQAAVAAGEGAGWPIGRTLAAVGYRTLCGSGDRSSGWVKTGPAGRGSAGLMAPRIRNRRASQLVPPALTDSAEAEKSTTPRPASSPAAHGFGTRAGRFGHHHDRGEIIGTKQPAHRPGDPAAVGWPLRRPQGSSRIQRPWPPPPGTPLPKAGKCHGPPWSRPTRPSPKPASGMAQGRWISTCTAIRKEAGDPSNDELTTTGYGHGIRL